MFVIVKTFCFNFEIDKMEHTHDLTNRLISGCSLKITTDEGDFEGLYKGVEDGVDGKEIQLFDCNYMGKQLPGIQSFALSDIEKMVPTHKETNNPTAINNENDVTKSENSSNHQLNGNIIPKTKSKSKVRDRPVICKVRKKNIADISHLNNLHLLRLPELLEQVQMEDPMHLHPSEHLSGAFIIPKPEQDSDHMEGDKYKNRHSVEYTAARNQTWKDTSLPPEIHVPELLILIKHESDPMFAKAIEQLRKIRTLAVSLEGQFLGRHGKLSLITFATPETVYMFDVVSIGSKCFDLGLRQILEDCDVQKGKLTFIILHELLYFILIIY